MPRKGLNWRVSIAAIVSLLAFSLRMVRLRGRPLWYDEAFAILYADLSPTRMIQGTVAPAHGAGAADVHPLLYYFSLHGWMQIVGRTPLVARFLSVVFGMLTVALLWRLAAWTFDRQTGLLVGLLAATNPFHVAYSQEARMYALLGLAVMVATWGLLRALQARAEGTTASETRSQEQNPPGLSSIPELPLLQHWKWWGLYAIGATLTLYVHNLGAFTLLALHLLVLTRHQWWRHLPALALADLVILVLFGPWLIGVLPGQLGFVSGGYWLTPPGADEIVRALMLPILTFYEPPPMWLLGLGLFVGLTILVLLVLHAIRFRSRVSWFLLLCWAPILALLAISQWCPLYLERALLPAALFYLVATGWLLTRQRLPHRLRWGLIILLGASVGGSLLNHYAYVGFPRPPFQQAVAYLETHVEPGDVVVHTNKLTYFPMYVYAPHLPAEFLADPPGSPQDTLAQPTQEALGIVATSTVSEAVGAASDVWLVYFARELAELESANLEHQPLTWLESDFVRRSQQQVDGLVIQSYRREEP